VKNPTPRNGAVSGETQMLLNFSSQGDKRRSALTQKDICNFLKEDFGMETQSTEIWVYRCMIGGKGETCT
jgi:hypothetical protein